MSLITWNDYFVTGIDIIDEQHKWLIDLINRAATVLVLPYETTHAAADELLDQLTEYAVFHFQTEEKLMAECGIDKRHGDHHRESHGDFATHVMEMRQRYEETRDISGGELLTFIANWLVFHILSDDQVLARQLKGIDTGLSPENAFEKAEGTDSDPAQQAQTQALIDLYQLINTQYSNLQAAHQELEEHRHNLEEQVARRTAQLAQARDLAEAASRAKSTFLANMSHEFRTPMNAITGMSWSLQKEIDNPHQREKLQIITKAAQRLQEMLAEVLDMVKLESEQLTLEPLDFSLHALLDHCHTEATTAAAAKGLELITEYRPDLPDMLHADARRIGQMLAHLLSNAIKFTERGRVTLRASVVPETPQQMRLHLEVEDTGCGIAAGDLDRLYLPFEQLDGSSTRTHGGAGLGLALCQRLARLMGGDISVQSKPGKGSIFRLNIPVRPALSSHATDSAETKTLSPTAPANISTDWQDVREKLSVLRPLIAEDDIRSLSLWHVSADYMQAALGPAAAHIEHELATYNFEAALAALDEALASLPA